MSDFNCAKIIRETRQTKHYLAISSAELSYITTCPTLSDGEKLIWITLANKSALDPQFSCTISQGELARQVGKTIGTVTRAITNLRIQGFLRSTADSHGALTYFLSLPQAGLEALLAAPTRKLQEDLSKITYPSIENDRTPLAKTIDILILNNKINNIKHNHDAHSNYPPAENPDVLDADALICDFKILIQEKYQHLPVFKRAAAALSHFTEVQKRAISERQLELTAITDGQKIQAERLREKCFTKKLAEAIPVPQTRTNNPGAKLVEFEFEGEHFLVEEAVKNQILNQIPNLYHQNKIIGAARQKTLNALLSEILFYVAKAGSKTLDACQLKRFHTARKLCQKGVWERPNGLERQASIAREQQWQQAKIQENKSAKTVMATLEQRVA